MRRKHSAEVLEDTVLPLDEVVMGGMARVQRLRVKNVEQPHDVRLRGTVRQEGVEQPPNVFEREAIDVLTPKSGCGSDGRGVARLAILQQRDQQLLLGAEVIEQTRIGQTAAARQLLDAEAVIAAGADEEHRLGENALAPHLAIEAYSLFSLSVGGHQSRC